MPIAASDLIAFSALNRPDDDTGTSGGAIDLDHRPVFTQLAANDDLEVLSSAAGDTTQTFTLVARLATGAKVTRTGTLNGTTPVSIQAGEIYERVLRFYISADAVGTVTLRRGAAGATVGTIPPAERGFHAFFVDSASEASPVARYEPLHWKNTHATLTLNAAKVQLSADPAAKITLGIETAKDTSISVTNRKTVPANPTFVDDGVDQNVPGTTLEAGSAIQTWIKQSLLASDSPVRSTFTTQLAGTTV